jgi:outer membrane protein TolC
MFALRKKTMPGGLQGAAAMLMLLLTVAPLPAQEPVQVTLVPGGEPPPSNLRIENGEIHLTLAEAVKIAIERNLNVRTMQYAKQRSTLGIQEAMGIYDFNLLGGASTGKDETPSASNLDGAEVQKTEFTDVFVGGSQLLPTGGVASINFPNGRFETNSSFSLLNPSYTSDLDAELIQPLMRGFGRSATEYQIDVAKVGDEISAEQFEIELVDTVRQVAIAYWNLVSARSTLQVAEESLGLAKELHENNRVRVDVGTLAPLELVQSEAGIATREEEIIRARGQIGDAEDLLFFFLNIEQGEAWSRSIVPDTDARTEPLRQDLEESIRLALTNRPEKSAQDLQIRIGEIDEAFFRQDAKPRLDLRARYGLSGLGGDVLQRDSSGNVIGTVPGDWSDAFDQVNGWDFPGWTVGVELGIPIQNRAARARAEIAALSLEESRLAASELELRITTEVRAAVRGIDTAFEQLESADVSQRLAEKNLDAERKKYDNGLSTSFQILEVQEDLTSARERVVAALTNYQRALVEYSRATGTLLDRASVRIVD